MVEHNGEADTSALARWSRRKQSARSQSPKQLDTSSDVSSSSEIEREQTGEEKALSPEQPVSEELNPEAALMQQQTAGEVECDVQQHPLEAGKSDEPLLTDDDMPEIESLDSKSDVSCFFNAGVSEKLRQAALRHLLRLPAFNITDGLNDYDEDYTTFEPLGDIVTSDMRFHAKRKAKLAEEQRLEEERLEAERLEAEQMAADTGTELEDGEEVLPEDLDEPTSDAEDLQVEEFDTETQVVVNQSSVPEDSRDSANKIDPEIRKDLL